MRVRSSRPPRPPPRTPALCPAKARSKCWPAQAPFRLARRVLECLPLLSRGMAMGLIPLLCPAPLTSPSDVASSSSPPSPIGRRSVYGIDQQV
jgi:hypothetical protein